MAVQMYKEMDITIAPGEVYTYNSVIGGNLVQFINRHVSSGGSLYVDTSDKVATDYYLQKIDSGNTGAVVRPRSIPALYLTTDAAVNMIVTIIEVVTIDLVTVYNTAQVVQVQGEVSVVQPIQISSGEIEVKNDSGNPLSVEWAGQSVAISGTPDVAIPGGVAITGTPNVAVPGGVAITGTPNVAVPGGVGITGTVSADSVAKIGVKVTAAGAGDQTVVAVAGTVYGIVAVGADIVLKDGATERWFVAAGGQAGLGAPIACGTSIVLNFSAAGDAYIIYA